MKPTNYHLFDFLDFDTELSRNESLWKAYKPTAVYEKEGDIYVTVPFQKQKLANDMMADTDVPQEEYTLIIRQYNIGITEGVFVYSTESGGAGERAGLQLGDVITKVNDTAITSMTDLSAAKKNYKAGDTVTLTVYRNGEYITLDLTFDEQPQTTGEDTTTDNQQDNQQQGGQDYSDMFRDFYNYYFGQNGR